METLMPSLITIIAVAAAFAAGWIARPRFDRWRASRRTHDPYD